MTTLGNLCFLTSCFSIMHPLVIWPYSCCTVVCWETFYSIFLIGLADFLIVAAILESNTDMFFIDISAVVQTNHRKFDAGFKAILYQIT